LFNLSLPPPTPPPPEVLRKICLYKILKFKLSFIETSYIFRQTLAF
jgi:hypothetical protein